MKQLQSPDEYKERTTDDAEYELTEPMKGNIAKEFD